jgi:D-proline reductase (dithiol) PrdB
VQKDFAAKRCPIAEARVKENESMPVAYIPRTRELYNEYAPYRWVVNTDAPPWTPLAKPISQCKVALMGSGGILYRDQPRFHREDPTYRLIPKSATENELDIWHFGYRIEDARSDPNCVFPLARMRELESDGVFGELSDPAYSFMGGIYSSRLVRDVLAPKIVEELKRAQADAFYLVPA